MAKCLLHPFDPFFGQGDDIGLLIHHIILFIFKAGDEFGDAVIQLGGFVALPRR